MERQNLGSRRKWINAASFGTMAVITGLYESDAIGLNSWTSFAGIKQTHISRVIFLHYFGKGATDDLAKDFRAALGRTWQANPRIAYKALMIE